MTNKQKLLAKKLLEKPSLPVSEAMRQVGYSPETAKVPSDITRSKGFRELMEKYLPDDKLLEKHEEALEATKPNEFTGEVLPDHSIRLKAVELGYKLKRHLGPEILQQFNTEELKIEFIK